MKILEWLKGKKTYMAAGALALTVLWQIAGTGDIDIDEIQGLAIAFGFAGMRHAIG